MHLDTSRHHQWHSGRSDIATDPTTRNEAGLGRMNDRWENLAEPEVNGSVHYAFIRIDK